MTTHEEKKARKKAQLKKNRQQQEMLWAFKRMREEGERVRKQEEEARKGKPAEKSGSEKGNWGDKAMEIRNRLTDKKRASRERWNRFAGTGGEGGRGL